jgi:metal-sulfur cluster biosynthetic enzyme
VTVTEAQVLTALREVMDPEFPISVVDLGLIQGVEVGDAGDVTVRVGFTSLGCPCTDLITEDIEACVQALAGVASIRVEEAFARWSKQRVSREGLRTLRVLGVV